MLEIKHLKKSFKISESRSTLVLNDINYKFPNKGMYFVLGKSGCGKSTLLNIMSGILSSDQGEILYNGKDINKLNKKDKNNYIRNEIGILFQRYNLIDDMTVLENLEVTKSIKNTKNNDYIDALLAKYELLEKKKQKVYLLSGGEKQRVALIRTLINNPKIIFCDEPTGALDEVNSIKLMENLKEISKEKLVIIVTHDNNLFNKFHDGFIYLENGSIIRQSQPVYDNDIPEYKIDSKKKHDSKFIRKVSFKNIKKNIKRNLVNVFSASFSVIVLLLSLFIREGILNSKGKLLNTYGDKNTFSISIVKNENIDDSPLSLERLERPTYNQVSTLLEGKSYVIDYSYDYFFANKCELIHGKRFEKKFDEFDIKPIIHPKLAIDECVMNKALFDQLEVEPFLNEISISCETSYSYFSEYSNTTIIEPIKFSFYLRVKEVVDEFNYMNTPTLYYHSTLMEKVLKNQEATKSTLDRDQKVTYYDLLTEAKDNSEISSYKLNVFAFNEDERKHLYEIMNQKSENHIFKLENFGYTMVNSFLDISNSVFLGMNIFIVLAILTSLFINGFLAYSSAILNRKESAILSSLGATNNEVMEIYLEEQLMMATLGICLGTLLSLITSSVLNNQFNRFFKFNNLINIDYIDTFLLIAIFIVLIFGACFLPLKIMKSKNVAEELKEEWLLN